MDMEVQLSDNDPMIIFHVQYRNQNIDISFNPIEYELLKDVFTISQLKVKLENHCDLKVEHMNLICAGKKLDNNDLLFDLNIGNKKITLFGSADPTIPIENVRIKDDLTNENRKQRKYEVDLRNLKQKKADTNFKFHAIETLPNLPEQEKAREILERLANDDGILAVLKKHQWSVGCLAELYPEGYVGVSEVCLMGLNQNKGQKILLRIRTDDLKGFRHFLSIKKVLYHELAHNEHGDHDDNFYILMRTIEKEAIELNWKESKSQKLSRKQKVYIRDDEYAEERVGEDSQAYKLGGSHYKREAVINKLTTTQNTIEPSNGAVQRENVTLDDDFFCESCQKKHIRCQNCQTKIPSDTNFSQVSDSDVNITMGGDVLTATSAEERDSQFENSPEYLQEMHVISTLLVAIDEKIPMLLETESDDICERVLTFRNCIENSTLPDIKTATESFNFVKKIIQNTEDSTKRSVKRSNKSFQRLIINPGLLPLLIIAGFQSEGENVNCKRYDKALQYLVLSLIELCLEELNATQNLLIDNK